MKKLNLIVTTCLVFGLGGFAIAQTDGTATEPVVDQPVTPAPETPAVADTPAAVEDDAAPEAAPAQPQIEVVTTKHGDWELRCTADKSDCFMYQLLHDSANNPVAEFTLLALPEGSKALAGATVVTPLGTLLEPGLIVQVDSGQARRYGFTWCDRSGCFARFGLEPAQVASYKRGNAAKMRLVSASNPEQPVDLIVSLSGFTAAFTEMEEARRAAVAQPAPAAPASE